MEILFRDDVIGAGKKILVVVPTKRIINKITNSIFIIMPHYQQLGTFPHKRHTQFRKPDGGLYSEQLFSTEGFSNDYSLLYHIHPPTQIIKTEPQVSVSPVIAEEKMLKHRSLEGFNLKPEKDFLQSRKRSEEHTSELQSQSNLVCRLLL